MNATSAEQELKRAAVITGASSGLGAVFARRLAAQGHDLLLVARRADKLRELAEELHQQHGVAVEVFPADLNDDVQAAGLAERIGRIDDLDFLVNNAGFGTTGQFADVSVERHLAMLKLHNQVAVRLIHAALPKMKARRGGNIINLSSLSSFFPAPQRVTYGSTKLLLNMLSEALQMEVAEYGIKVQALCPGLTRTEFHYTEDFKGFSPDGVPGFMWSEAEDVVDGSLKALAKGKTVYVPGLLNKIMARVTKNRALLKGLRAIYRKRAVKE